MRVFNGLDPHEKSLSSVALSKAQFADPSPSWISRAVSRRGGKRGGGNKGRGKEEEKGKEKKLEGLGLRNVWARLTLVVII